MKGEIIDTLLIMALFFGIVGLLHALGWIRI